MDHLLRSVSGQEDPTTDRLFIRPSSARVSPLGRALYHVLEISPVRSWDVQHELRSGPHLFQHHHRPGPTTKEAFEATEVRLTLTRAAIIIEQRAPSGEGRLLIRVSAGIETRVRDIDLREGIIET